MSNRVILCFDHGEKRIGVAVGQAVTASATPLEIIHCKQGKPDWLKITSLIDQWHPSDIVVGKPLTMEGKRQAATDAAEKFARQLQGRYMVPLHFADERLSSHEARQRLKDSYNVDSVAAQLILETWLADQPALQSTDKVQDNETRQ